MLFCFVLGHTRYKAALCYLAADNAGIGTYISHGAIIWLYIYTVSVYRSIGINTISARKRICEVLRDNY